MRRAQAPVAVRRIAVAILICSAQFGIASTALPQCDPFETLKLTAADAAKRDRFGISVAIGGAPGNEIAIVGADSNDEAGTDAGAAYLLDVATGQELFKLMASDGASEDWFGCSVAISGTTAIVGASGNRDYGYRTGSAYLFDVVTGQELFKLTAADAAALQGFGTSVAISGTPGNEIAIVGAYVIDDDPKNFGSAYLFDVATGKELFKLIPSDAVLGDFFGWSVAIHGNTAIVGANRNYVEGNEPGAAYLFDVTTGTELFKLTAPDATARDLFGISVAIDGNTAIIGANRSNSAYLFDVNSGQELFKLTTSDVAEGDNFGNSVAITGNVAIVGAFFNDYAGNNSGSVYGFDVSTGLELFRITSTDIAEGDFFGVSVATSGNKIVVGASGNDDDGSASGSAYIFDLDCCRADISGSSGIGPDGAIDGIDLELVLSNWSANGPGAGIAVPADVVDVFDLLDLLAAWGPCS